MLRIDLGAARSGAVETPGRIDASDPLWERVEVSLAAPLDIRGRFSAAGEGKYFWHATMETVLRLECRRCLAPVEVPLRHEMELLFAAEDEALDDDVGCYVIPSRTAELDLRDAVREELVLAAPQYVECSPECLGLCPRCGANLNAGACACRPERDPRWAALEALRPDRPDEDR